MPTDGLGHRRSFRVARDVVAGLVLCLTAAAAYFGIRDLPISDPSGIGPGLVPKTVALTVAMLGLIIVGLGFPATSRRLDHFSIRGPLFVLGAVALFAATIRSLGLALAGPLAVMVAGLADRESRPFELAIFSLVLSALCVGLFKYVLRLPIPLAPFLLGY
ncbi:MAG: tripartite tricarboxylate transporter TctB family protein [Hyphomicrobiaceae bacterium]|nr:tripartite tricarboxylate transporter TctB family protein [Hyphomicrobiaceae bacterium]